MTATGSSRAARPASAPAALTAPLTTSPLREAIRRLARTPEPQLLPGLLEQARLPAPMAAAVRDHALRIARGVRESSRAGGRAGLVQGLLQEFALSSQEGVALMCLAEALLRIPDAATRDALIRDKIGQDTGVDWQRHLGQSPSLFVNAAAWGLLLTGKLVATHSDRGMAATLRRAVARGGEPLIRKGVDMAMRMMGEQFVTGETIEQALQRARGREAQGFRYSYDMLGEAALTAGDAERYFAAYEQAIDAIGRASASRGCIGGPGISVKLSALHPRYARAQVGPGDVRAGPAADATGAAGPTPRHRAEHRRRRIRSARSVAGAAAAAVLRAAARRVGTASASSSRPTRSAARRWSTIWSTWRAAAVTA